jgi:SAM-dependent methyltransferase
MPKDLVLLAAVRLFLSRFIGLLPLTGLAARQRVAALKLKPGQTVIFYGCRRLSTLLVAARKIGPRGRLICIDPRLSPVDRARHLACRHRLSQVEAYQASGDVLPFPAHLADVVYACEQLPASDHPLALLEELARLLRPSARLILENRAWSNRRTMALVAAVPALVAVKGSGRQVRCKRRLPPQPPSRSAGDNPAYEM